MKLGNLRIELHPLFRDLRWQRLSAVTRELRPYLKPVRRDLLLAVLCSIGGVLMVIARPWPTKMVLDYAILPTGRVKWVFPYHLMKGYGAMGVVTIACAFLFVVTLLWGLFAFYQRYLIAGAGQKVTYALRRRLFAHLQRLSISYHHRQRVGDLLLRATGDTTMLREMVVDAVMVILSEFLVLLAMLCVMFAIDWQLTLISVAVLPLLAVAVFHISGNLRTAVRRQRKKEGRVASLFGEMLQSIAVIQAFGREAHSEDRFKGSNQQALRQGLRTVRLEANLERVAEALIALGTGGVLWFGVDRVLDGVLTPGDLVVFTAYLASMYRPLRRIARLTGRLSKAMVSSERVFSVLGVREHVKVHPHAPPAPPLRGRLTFKHVSFAYEPGRPVLRDVSFTVGPGRTVALVGPNGAGKSTLCALIPRLLDPTEGQITVDGQKISRFSLESFRDQIGVVLQEPLLFAASVRDNITFGKPEATMDEIVAAAELAEAHDFITKLPDGYDTVVGERGGTLSVGQRQKIAIARAVIKEPVFLILDEPTAALDPASAAQLNHTLTALAAGRTTVRATHRLAEVQTADLILVLQNGEVVQRGAHDQLIAEPGWYRTVSTLQAAVGEAQPTARAAVASAFARARPS
jgi:ABC-type multidrug transport system fused ATPase/permease subunit